VRLGFSISGHRSGGSSVEIAQLAEQEGFEEIWVTEDYCERGAFSLAGAIAGATQRARIGIGVVNPWTRHPVLTAMEFAALDELSEGRAVLGLGASNPKWMQHELGLPFHKPLQRLRESVEIIRSLLGGEAVKYAGDVYSIDTSLAFSPPRSEPPVWLGVKGEKAIALAAELSDGILLSVLSAPAYVGYVRERVPAEVGLAAYVVFGCQEDVDVARSIVATFLGVHGDHVITSEAGLDRRLAKRFREAWMEGRPAIELVDDAILNEFAVVGEDVGCARRFDEFARSGLQCLIVRDDPRMDGQRLLRRARRCSMLMEHRSP
jgi:5,10-methylenetetrahydromethanopterin reductase